MSKRKTGSPLRAATPKTSPIAPQLFHGSPRWSWAIAAGLLAMGTLLRVLAARDEFWLDEIWSLNFASSSQSALDILRIAHDNNHHLVTLWMYLVGEQDSWFVYRLPSLAAGVATVALAGAAGNRYGRAEGLIALLLTAFSLVLITYGSEARGYALAGMFALVGWLALDRYLVRRDFASNLAFCGAVALGMLAHVTFLYFIAGAAAWWLTTGWREGWAARRWVIDWSRIFLVPAICVGTIYVVYVRPMVVGGGPQYDWSSVAIETLALTAGVMAPEPLQRVAALLVIAALAAACFQLKRDRLPLTLFFAMTIAVAPLATLLFSQPGQIYPRYFYLPLLFSLLLLSLLAGQLLRRGTSQRVAVATGLAAYLIASGLGLADFLSYGRGGCFAALRYIVANSGPGTIVVESNHDFRMSSVLHFYYRYLPPDTPLAYKRQNAKSDQATQWVILWDQRRDHAPLSLIKDSQGHRFALEKVFPYAGLSGFHWSVYRSMDFESSHDSRER